MSLKDLKIFVANDPYLTVVPFEDWLKLGTCLKKLVAYYVNGETCPKLYADIIWENDER